MMDAGERKLLEETVRTAVRRARPGAEGGAGIDAVLAQIGWLPMLEAELGDAIAIVFHALGAFDATATALDDVIVAGLGREPRDDLAVLLPPFGRWDPPGSSEAGWIRAEGLATGRVTTGSRLLVVHGPAAAPSVVVVPTSTARLRALPGVDPGAELYAVAVEGDATSAERLDAAAWDSAVALARRAVAHQMAGACRSMLALAQAHAKDRVQFGRAIATFQAVRHRLAETLVAVEALEATLDAAAREPIAETAALAKAAAGRAAHAVGVHCQQILAGIGFTTEHSFHRFLKRTMVLEGLFGSADEIVVDLGRRLLASRRVPKLIEL